MLKRKKMKKIYIFVALIIIIGSFLLPRKFIMSKDDNKNTMKVMDTIHQVLETTTTKYNYSNIITIKKNKEWANNMKIPFTEKSYVIKYDGVINAGFKLDSMKITKISADNINIQINKCEIFDHYIDEKNIYVYDMKNTIFNKIGVNEIFEELNNSKIEYEKDVMKNGLEKEVKENTKKSVETALKNLGYKEVIVDFKE